jgi:hypothetical protein
MLIDGLSLVEGSTLTNLTIASGAQFPAEAGAGELFYKDNDGVYYHDNTSWHRLVRAGEVTAIPWSIVSGKPTTIAGYAISDAINTNKLGAANGVATLDANSKVPAGQLPSYVDDILECANYAALPATGSTGVIYVTTDTNKIYRWTGFVYVEIVASPGTSDAVPEGTTNLYFTSNRVLAVVNNYAATGVINAANKLVTPRTINLTGSVAGSAVFDGTEDITITTTGGSGGGSGGGGSTSIYAQFSGPVTPTVGVSPYYPRDTITVTNVFSSLSTPASSVVSARINVNGFSRQVVTIGIGQKTSTTVTNFSVTPDDYITVDIIGGSGNNLTVRLDH